MKQNFITIEDIKNKIENLKGQSVEMLVVKGRKRKEKFNVEIVDLYNSVFTVKQQFGIAESLVSYAYSEVLCGHVKILNKNWFFVLIEIFL